MCHILYGFWYGLMQVVNFLDYIFYLSWSSGIPPCSFTHCHPSPYLIAEDRKSHRSFYTCSNQSCTPHYSPLTISITVIYALLIGCQAILSCFPLAARLCPLLYTQKTSTWIFTAMKTPKSATSRRFKKLSNW